MENFELTDTRRHTAAAWYPTCRAHGWWRLRAQVPHGSLPTTVPVPALVGITGSWCFIQHCTPGGSGKPLLLQHGLLKLVMSPIIHLSLQLS